METYNLQYMPRVTTDLAEIHAYVSRDSVSRASALVARIVTAVDALKFAPHRNVIERRGRKLKHPVRTLPIGSYVVYFRVIEDEKTVRVLHIRHGSRRSTGRLD